MFKECNERPVQSEFPFSIMWTVLIKCCHYRVTYNNLQLFAGLCERKRSFKFNLLIIFYWLCYIYCRLATASMCMIVHCLYKLMQLRSEGKDYVLQEGDIMLLFNVWLVPLELSLMPHQQRNVFLSSGVVPFFFIKLHHILLKYTKGNLGKIITII